MPEERWKYKIDRQMLDEQDEITDEIALQIEERLNQLGLQGWELEQLMRGPHHLTGVFKQEIVPTPGAPVCVVPPILDKTTAIVGDTVACTTGTWETTAPEEPLIFTYQWTRDLGGPGAVGRMYIMGANAPTLVLTAEDVPYPIDCFVTATNSYGAKLEYSSNRCAVTEVVGR